MTVSLKFHLRAPEMGLTSLGNEIFRYDDVIGSVMYKHLQSKDLVEVVEELGADAFVYGKPADSSVKFANAGDEGAQVIVRWDTKNPPKPGDTITVTAAAASVHLFSSSTGERVK